MAWSASLFFSISSLKLPQREYSGGISVRLIQPPFAYRKKSSDGLTDGSMSFISIGVRFFSILGLAASSDFVVSVDTIGVGLGLSVSLAGGEFFCGSDWARKVSAQEKARSVTATCLIIDVLRNRRSNVKWQTLLARVWVDSNVTAKSIARFVPQLSARKSRSVTTGYRFRRMANVSFTNRFWDFTVP